MLIRESFNLSYARIYIVGNVNITVNINFIFFSLSITVTCSSSHLFLLKIHLDFFFH
jgi:hypothetical protein